MAGLITEQLPSRPRRGWLRRLRFAEQQLIILLAGIVPLLILVAVLLVWGMQEHRRAIELGLTNTSVALAVAVDKQIIAWRSALNALATSPAFDDRNFAELHEQAVAVAKQHQGNIVVFDRTLRQRLNTLRPYGEPLPAAGYPDPVRRAFETGEPQISGPFVGKVATEWLISLDVPVKRGGLTIFSLNLSFPPSHLSDLLRQELLSPRWIVHIVNDQDQFVARSEGDGGVTGKAIPDWYAAAIANSEFGVIEGPSPAGGPEEVLAVHRLREAPWTLAVAAPQDTIAVAWRTPFLFGQLSLVLFLGAAGLAWLFSRRVTRPIAALAGAAEDVLVGRATRLAPLKIPEFELLRQALARAAASAREQIAAEERAAAAEKFAEEMRQSEERQALLASEVDHRAKNLLTVVQSILHRTRADSVEGYVHSIQERIMALSRSHSLLAASRWEGADLAQIVEDELAPYRGREQWPVHEARSKADGPLVTLRPAAAQTLAMAIHELTTNALKYGAYSGPDGRLSVAWRVAEEGLILTWDETRSKPIAGPPAIHGFGMTVIAAGIEHQLSGRVAFDWRPQGLLVTILVPSDHWTAGRAAARRTAPSSLPVRHIPGSVVALSGRRVLVVEDDALIATHIESLLVARGSTIVGPAADLDSAVTLARSEELDGAILDVNLAGTRSDAVATALSDRGIPFVALTGYANRGLPGAFRGAPVVAKPFDESALLNALAREITGRSSPRQSPPAGA